MAAATTLSRNVEPGEHLLVGEAFGANLALPPIESDIDGTIAISGTGGKVALTSTRPGADLLSAAACAATPQVVDLRRMGREHRHLRGHRPAPRHDQRDVGGPPDPAVQHGEQRRRLHDGAPPTPAASARTAGPGDVSIAAIQGTGAGSPDVERP